MPKTTNAAIADRFREAATILKEQGANPFRVSAYRRAADIVMGLEEERSRQRVSQRTSPSQ